MGHLRGNNAGGRNRMVGHMEFHSQFPKEILTREYKQLIYLTESVWCSIQQYNRALWSMDTRQFGGSRGPSC